MSSQLTEESGPAFYLHCGREGERVLSCCGCGSRLRIEDRPDAMTEAEAGHECDLPCGCWSAEVHAASEGACADD